MSGAQKVNWASQAAGFASDDDESQTIIMMRQ